MRGQADERKGLRPMPSCLLSSRESAASSPGTRSLSRNPASREEQTRGGRTPSCLDNSARTRTWHSREPAAGLRKLTPEKHRGTGMTNQKIFGEFEFAANVPRVNQWTARADATVRCGLADGGEVIPAFPPLCHPENGISRPVRLLPPKSRLLKPKVAPPQI